MGSHQQENQAERIRAHHGLSMITLQAWPVGGSTYITTSGLYLIEGQESRQGLGAHVHPSDLFQLPSLNQTFYAVMQESLKAWRELSSPK